MTIFKKIIKLPEFEKDLKKLRKKFRTIDEDLQTFIKRQLYLYHKLKIDNKGIFPIPHLKVGDKIIFKAKKFACRSLKGTGSQSGIRVVYTYCEKEDTIKLIEIYYKGIKQTEDRKRIMTYNKLDIL